MNSRFPIINGLTCDVMWKQKEFAVVMFFLGGGNQNSWVIGNMGNPILNQGFHVCLRILRLLLRIHEYPCNESCSEDGFFRPSRVLRVHHPCLCFRSWQEMSHWWQGRGPSPSRTEFIVSRWQRLNVFFWDGKQIKQLYDKDHWKKQRDANH